MAQRTRTDGFSLRDALIRQGVSNEMELAFHMARVNKLLELQPNLDVKRYRVNRSNA